MAGVGEVAGAVTAVVNAAEHIAKRHDAEAVSLEAAAADVRAPLPDPVPAPEAISAISSDGHEWPEAWLQAIPAGSVFRVVECPKGSALGAGSAAEAVARLVCGEAFKAAAVNPRTSGRVLVSLVITPLKG